jgi:hypothetical protein
MDPTRFASGFRSFFRNVVRFERSRVSRDDKGAHKRPLRDAQ